MEEGVEDDRNEDTILSGHHLRKVFKHGVRCLV